MVASLVALGVVLLGLSYVDLISEGLIALFGLGEWAWLAPFAVLCFGFALLRFTGQGMLTMVSRAMLG